MVFGILGSPIYENFQDTPNDNDYDNDNNNENNNNGNNNNVDYKTCIKRCDKTEELNGTSEEAESNTTAVEEEAEEEAEEEEEEEESNTTAVEEEEEESNTTAVEAEEEVEEEEVEEEDEETDTEESFSGSMNIEHFSGKNVTEKVLSLNLLLKSILFACLFYIIAHPDTKVFLLQNLKFLKKSDYLMISMVLFFICYYILSIFV